MLKLTDLEGCPVNGGAQLVKNKYTFEIKHPYVIRLYAEPACITSTSRIPRIYSSNYKVISHACKYTVLLLTVRELGFEMLVYE